MNTAAAFSVAPDYSRHAALLEFMEYVPDESADGMISLENNIVSASVKESLR